VRSGVTPEAFGLTIRTERGTQRAYVGVE
jgi:hypothetical protein